MKKVSAFLLFCILALTLCACAGGNTANVQVGPYQSEVYRDSDVQSAIDAAVRYFKKGFSGCTLTDIAYAGDDATKAYSDWAYRHDADEVIVLVSNFDVGPFGGDGSLNPNSTYKNWKWILVRNGGGAWRHVDHGY